MHIFKQPIYILTESDYKSLTNPDKTYTTVTKSGAKDIVKNLLKSENVECYLDIDIDRGDWCCSICPVIDKLGNHGERLCDRQKAWSK